MNVLKAFATGARLVFGFAASYIDGQVKQQIATAGSVLSQVVFIIGAVERTAQVFKGADGTGQQKLEAALPLVSDIIRHSELVAGRDIVDESKFEDGIKQIIAGFVSVLNSVKH